MLVLIKHILEKTGRESLEQVWPDLEVFFHGGVAFTPYREQYQQIIRSPRMHYVETYNASEGYFGTQNDPADPAMLLMVDYGIFYEFVPLEDIGSDAPRTYSLDQVETGRNYALVISTSAGLWRYMIGDTVRFTSIRPYKFVITGRTKHFINAFGEELIVDNAEKALARACQATGGADNRLLGGTRLHGRTCQMPPPVARGVCPYAGRRAAVRARAGRHAQGSQLRLRSQTPERPRPYSRPSLS